VTAAQTRSVDRALRNGTIFVRALKAIVKLDDAGPCAKIAAAAFLEAKRP